jgi:putative restriction endonuclease
MNLRQRWVRSELLIAMNLYCKLPFGRLDHRNPIIIEISKKLGRTPSSLAMKLTNIASLDPVQQARGVKGLKGASNADRAIWQEFQENWEQLGTESEARFQELMGETDATSDTLPDTLIASLDLDPSLLGDKQTEKIITTKVRLGQSFFRQMVLSAYKNRCCITGNPIPDLLVASHIIPWSQQSEHRLNPRNGLCLARTHDAAFDKGLITLDEDCRLVLSHRLQEFLPNDALAADFVAYSGQSIHLPEKFMPDPNFLRHHREEVFFGS